MISLIFLVNTLVYVLMVKDAAARDCEGVDGYFTDKIMMDWQAANGYKVKHQLQIWRLALCGYVHADFWHYFGNMIVFVFYGTLVEWQIGNWHVFNMFNFINFFGNVTSLITNPQQIGIGASTAIYGFIGAVSGAALKQKYGMRSEFFWIYFPIVFVWNLKSFIENFSGEGDTTSHGSGFWLGFFYVMIWVPDVVWVGGWKSKYFRECIYWVSVILLATFNAVQCFYFFAFVETQEVTATC